VDVSVYDESGAFLQAVTSEGDGTYAISGLPQGTYTVDFEPSGSDYVGQFYDGAAESADATQIVLAAGATKEGVDARLAPGATVEGTVTAAGGGPLEEVEVHVQPTGGGLGGAAITDVEGNYSVTGLRPGGYTVQFVPTDGNYAGL
jgi:protocatechuate 3,4-dioxygenase beta subunit